MDQGRVFRLTTRIEAPPVEMGRRDPAVGFSFHQLRSINRAEERKIGNAET
jgi:hypothetical protein